MSTTPSSRPLDDSLESAMFIVDASGCLTFAEVMAPGAWMGEMAGLLGRPFAEVVRRLWGLGLPEPVLSALGTGQRAEFSLRRAPHGTLGITVTPHAGQSVVLLQHRGRGRSTRRAERDPLTRCLTRQGFFEIQAAASYPCLLVLIDLNQLKAVNTLRGHSGGDAHLRAVAGALRRAAPPGAHLCRWGGDEFLLLLPEATAREGDAVLARALDLAPSPCPGVPAFSAGMAPWVPGTPFERAFALADEALQEGKQALQGGGDHHAQSTAFLKFSQFLETLHDPEEIKTQSLHALLTLLDFDGAYFMEWDGQELFMVHSAERPGVPSLALPRGQRYAHSGLALKVYATGQTSWSTDYPAEPGAFDSLVRGGVKSAVLTPVRHGGQIIGTLNFVTVGRWRTITPHVRSTVELAALRLEHALELRRISSLMRQALDGGLLALGVALEARDLETHGHTDRVADLTVQLGRQLGLHPRELERLREGAYLHDLGKLEIPDAILRKPGPLTPEEWKVMQTHVTRGWHLACRIPHLSPDAMALIRHHHERWDGTGYPEGLQGEAIPLGARIFAVCDVYDALISPRPYKAAWTAQAALEEIRTQAGKQFDPTVVQAFLALPLAAPQLDRPASAR